MMEPRFSVLSRSRTGTRELRDGTRQFVDRKNTLLRPVGLFSYYMQYNTEVFRLRPLITAPPRPARLGKLTASRVYGLRTIFFCALLEQFPYVWASYVFCNAFWAQRTPVTMKFRLPQRGSAA